jgi:hypothetical protein
MLRVLENPAAGDRVTGWCPDCRLGWTGTRDAHCARCCRHFATEQAFDAHQRMNRGRTVCRDPGKLRGRLILDDRTWTLAGTYP